MTTLVSWNVLADVHAHPQYYREVPPAIFADRRARVLDRVGQLLEEVDVLCLQEVEHDLAEQVRVRVRDVAYAVRPSGSDGVLLASARHRVSHVEMRHTHDQRRVLLRARVAGLWVTCVHLDWSDPDAPSSRGATQGRELVRWMAPLPDPVVLAGDINDAWSGRTGAVLAAGGYRCLLPDDVPTASVDGRARSLDVVAGRGVDGRAWTSRHVGDGVWLPDGATASDHVEVWADLNR